MPTGYSFTGRARSGGFQRRTQREVEDGTETTTESAPYELSRAAMRERYGARAIDGSAPNVSGASRSPVGTMGGGLTPSSTWESFFPAKPLVPQAWGSSATAAPTRTPLYPPRMTPQQPQDATAMATAARETGFSYTSQNAAPATKFDWNTPADPIDYVAAGTQAHEKWFDDQGLTRRRPNALQRARSGDTFTSKRYGGGGFVTSGTQIDRSRKMALLGMDSDLDFDF